MSLISLGIQRNRRGPDIPVLVFENWDIRPSGFHPSIPSSLIFSRIASTSLRIRRFPTSVPCFPCSIVLLDTAASIEEPATKGLAYNRGSGPTLPNRQHHNLHRLQKSPSN